MKTPNNLRVHEPTETPPERSVQGVVVWRVWHVGDKRWCWRGQNFDTRNEAEKACVKVTRAKRDTMSNYFRICTRVVRVLPDGSSPERDECQRLWDLQMEKPDNKQISDS